MAGPFFVSEDMMPDNASDLARRMARQAEAVCRHYLSNGRREGRYWLVGDARNTPGRSMFVRLQGAESGPRPLDDHHRLSRAPPSPRVLKQDTPPGCARHHAAQFWGLPPRVGGGEA